MTSPVHGVTGQDHIQIPFSEVLKHNIRESSCVVNSENKKICSKLVLKILHQLTGKNKINEDSDSSYVV